jgi:hypothetical protein
MWQDDKVVRSSDYADFPGTNWEKAIKYCEVLSLGNYDDWRLPSYEELLTLINYGKTPAISSFFRNIEPLNEEDFDLISYWTSTPLEDSDSDSFAWMVNFYKGTHHYSGRVSNYHVRCVRGEELHQRVYKRDDSTDIVKDLSSGLEWQDNILLSDADLDQYSGDTALEKSINYCETLNLDDKDNWRLPNNNELLSLFNNHALASIFEQDKALYRSSTSSIDGNQNWLIYSGRAGSYLRDNSLISSIRCVRGELPPSPQIIISILDNSDTDKDTKHITFGIELYDLTFDDNLITVVEPVSSNEGISTITAENIYIDPTHAKIIVNVLKRNENSTIYFKFLDAEFAIEGPIMERLINSNSLVIRPN